MRTINVIGLAVRQITFLRASVGEGKGRKKNSPKRAASLKHMSCEQGKEDHHAVDYQHKLIDYKNNNQVIKSKMMTFQEAHDKNQLLKGSGFAWARCS